MKHFIYSILFLSASGASLGANAQSFEQGEYDSMTRDEFLSLTTSQKKRYFYFGTENGKDIYACADWARGVPGKLIDGWCYVGWRNKEYRNESYQALRSGYKIKSPVTFIEGDSLISAGAGLGHCSVFEGGTRGTTVGSYNIDDMTCAISWKGKQYYHSPFSGPHSVNVIIGSNSLFPR